MLYSKTTGGFYDPATHGARKLVIVDPEWVDEGDGAQPPTIEIDNPDCKMPPDAREIADEHYASLLAAQDSGKRITSDADGFPVAVDPTPETAADALTRALADIRRQRAPILSALDGIAGRTFRAGDMATAAAADAAINALLDITKLPALLQAETYDDMKAAVLARYRQIAAAAPAVVQSAFIEAVAP